MTRTALFVADASVAIGAGHVERCMALADQFRLRGWRCIFMSSPESASIAPSLMQFERISAAQRFEDGADIPLEELEPDGCDLAIVDHYGWTARQEALLRAWSTAVMAVDDLANRKHDCDILLDQTVGRQETAYDGLVPPHCRRLVGAAYALLRPEFSSCRKAALARRHERRIERVMVNFGGTDPHGNTLLALRALQTTGLKVDIDVAMGAGAPHLAQVDAFCSSEGVKAALHVNSRQMATLMSNADLAIGAAGVAAIERCVVGLPSLILIDADNQNAIAQELGRRGAAAIVGRGGDVGVGTLASAIADLHQAPGRRLSMASAASELCDGLGAPRTADILEACLDS